MKGTETEECDHAERQTIQFEEAVNGNPNHVETSTNNQEPQKLRNGT